MTRTAVALGVVVLIALASGRADAYPSYQLSHEKTCSGCHLSPSGGQLLSENGLAVAETMSQWGTAPEFFYGKIPTPDWLTLGGDLRSSAGFMMTPEKVLAAFPMQGELYASAKFATNFNFVVTGGIRPMNRQRPAATAVWSREHYLMWRQKADEPYGAFVRAGRFMPVFGLRLVEHPTYTRRYGGTQLFADTYGLHAAYVHEKIEAHITGFIEDPLLSSVAHDDGAAAYAELRINDTTQVGGEFMFTQSPDDKKLRAGITGKVYIPSAKLLLQAEIQYVNQIVDVTPTNPDGGAPLQLVGNVVGTYSVTDALMIDLGVGHFDSNIRVKNLDRDCADLNVRFMATSHLELQLNSRFEMIAFGNGGPSAAYALAQLHYRL